MKKEPRVNGGRARRGIALTVAFCSLLLSIALVPQTASAQAGTSSVHFLLDISGSMSSTTPTGTRLGDAKTALLSALDDVSPNTNVGLRSFEGSCGDGGDLNVPIGPLDKPSFTTTVNALNPGGTTPTPAALEAAAMDFPASGNRTLVLISDGQSTCGDPCPTAVNLAATLGINFTVHTVGFNAPSTAATELDCIARSTGGTYVAVSDEAGLAGALGGLVSGPTDCRGPVAHPYTDVPAASFAGADIGCVSANGIALGTTPTTFGPSDIVTREQMAAFLARLYSLVSGDPCNPGLPPFTDISTSFAQPDIACVWSIDVALGTTPTTYSPADPVTREQMAAFLARLYRKLSGEACTGIAPPFGDVPMTSFAYDDIGCVNSVNIARGTTTTTYDPGAYVNREQMAAFLARLFRLTYVPSAP